MSVCQGQRLYEGVFFSWAAQWRKFWLLIQGLSDFWLVIEILFAEWGLGCGLWPLGDVFAQPTWHDLSSVKAYYIGCCSLLTFKIG